MQVSKVRVQMSLLEQMIVVGADGLVIKDSRGNEYLDATSGGALVPYPLRGALFSPRALRG